MSVDSNSFEGLIGRSSKIQTVIRTVKKVAGTDAPILIVGESGTGKELVAKAIHRRSSRKEGPLIVINCGAIPESLLETELFGHERGAFTGAHAQRKGRIEMAQGGTLFFDEIGDLPVALQVKLLRFLQEHEVERVGGRSPITVDARVIAATNVNLQEAMVNGTFREDLYYRLSVVVIPLPPLRDRREDIQLLSQVFLTRHISSREGKLTLTPGAMTALESYEWPGNIRELQNRIKRGVIMADNGRITSKDLGIVIARSQQSVGLADARDSLEREMIELALSNNKGNISRTAADLEISRPTLYERIEKLGIARR